MDTVPARSVTQDVAEKPEQTDWSCPKETVPSLLLARARAATESEGGRTYVSGGKTCSARTRYRGQ